MRFATVTHQGSERCGVVTGDGIHFFPDGVALAGLIQFGLSGLVAAGERIVRDVAPIDLAEVSLRPPLQPSTVRDFMAFERHVEGVARGFGESLSPAWFDEPVFYFSNPYSMIGAHDPVRVPPGCQVFDFELEVAAVIGVPGADLTPERAREHIVGYTILNDWSARDLQAREMRVRLGPSKGKDSVSTLGPWLVTADELDPRRDAAGFLDCGLTVAVNDVVVGTDTLASMAWTFEELVAHASRGAEVRTGDVLGSGTCGNGGCLAELWGRSGRQHPAPLQPGDTVTMTVEGIGAISNTVVRGDELTTVPPARRRVWSW